MKEVTVQKQSGMGAIPLEDRVAFRVWAPHADAVSVIGSFNDWTGGGGEMESEGNGSWYTEVEGAKGGDEYKFRIINGDQTLDRIDPYARQVTNSVGNGVIYDSEFDWGDDNFEMPPWNEITIYEMHLGTFFRRDGDKPGGFDDAIERLDHLRHLGVNVLQLMPTAEFAGDISWGYNPAHLFAIESAYGGPDAFKRFVKAAHERGFAVIMDVVYNHFGPSDLDLWQFDGWSENGKGGIYFYNDHRSSTPWGDTRPDYGRGEVRQFIHDNAMMWIEDFRVDGLRYDMTLYIRSIDGSAELPDGWGLTQWINRTIHERKPSALTIAEDLQNNDFLTKPEFEGGAGFSTQWDSEFVHPVREVLTQIDDAHRSMPVVCGAIQHRYNVDAFERVIYTESHDEVANGKARVPAEIAPEDQENYHAQKRSALGAGLVFTVPGIPMVFQGQEFLEGDWFQDTEELDWEKRDRLDGIVRLYADLIRLRLNREGMTAGLTGQSVQITHCNDHDKVVAFLRSRDGGPGDDVIVVAHFANCTRKNYQIGFPCEGRWKLRFSSDSSFYSPEFCDIESSDCDAVAGEYDSLPASSPVHLGPYDLLIYSQDR